MLVDKCVVVELSMRDRGAGVESVNQDFAAPLSLKIGRAWENHHYKHPTQHKHYCRFFTERNVSRKTRAPLYDWNNDRHGHLIQH
jgi:hypothetical protein